MHDIRKIRSVTNSPFVEDVLRKREAPKKKKENGFEEELKRQEREMGEEEKTQSDREKSSLKKKTVKPEEPDGNIKGRVDIKA